MTSSIYSLPISPLSPIYHLPPDPLFPSPQSLFNLSSYVPPSNLAQNGPVELKSGDPVPPSMLRRSRAIREGAAFCYVTPLPLEFPYDITEPGDEKVEGDGKKVGEETQAKPITIESYLASYELSPLHPVPSSPSPNAFTSPSRLSLPLPRLLSFSHSLHTSLLPQLQLDLQDILPVLAGQTILARLPDPDAHPDDIPAKRGFAPWSLCYAGHQFGSFAGQLGDGRAVSILSTPTTPEVESRTGMKNLELQLKGAGRTPFSRFADGLAVLRSSIREYLGAEAMAALGQPTSRALALVGIKEVKVRRERIETAAIVTRVADSWLRIGNFEIHSYRKSYNSLLSLVHHVHSNVLHLPPSLTPALDVLSEISKRNAIMVAGWQATGFMHGVINTDNVSVTGKCIDYGPYAFMDIFDPLHICNHSDDLGRYSFRNQPTMILFAIDKLGQSLAELIGCESELKEGEKVEEGWGEEGEMAGWMEGWKEVGVAKLKEVKEEFQGVFLKEYTRIMRTKFGLATDHKDDFDLVSSFLTLLESHSLDYTNSFRLLSQHPGIASSSFDKYLDLLLPSPSENTSLSFSVDRKKEWTSWFEKYDARLAFKGEGEMGKEERGEKMNASNPRFTLRQWVLEETIAKAEQDDLGTLELVFEMAQSPYEAYGERTLEREEGESCENEKEREKVRLCGVGSENMLGFQCSCSS